MKVVVDVQGLPATPKPDTPPPIATSAPPTAAIAAGPPPNMSTAITASPGVKFVPALMTTILVCLLLRVLLIPFVDLLGRSSAAVDAATKVGFEPAHNSPFSEFGGWLRLPWLAILGGSDAKFSAGVFQPGNNAEVSTLEFRHYFDSYFIRWFMLRTWWIGAILAVIFVLQRGGGSLDIPWAVIAGAFAGLAVSATLAAFFLVAEMVPHLVWHFAIGPHGGVGFLLLWTLLAVFCWLLIGIALGIVLPWIGPLRRLLIDPFQRLIAGGFRAVGMATLADYWMP